MYGTRSTIYVDIPYFHEYIPGELLLLNEVLAPEKNRGRNIFEAQDIIEEIWYIPLFVLALLVNG